VRSLVVALAALAALTATGPSSGGTAACTPNVANRLKTVGAADQLITVRRPATRPRAPPFAWARAATAAGARSPALTARVGWNGLRRPAARGDGTMPTGVYSIGRTMARNASSPGVRYRYRRLVCGDWWNEGPRCDAHTVPARPLRDAATVRTTTPGLWQEQTAYRHFAVIEFNMRPVVPGRSADLPPREDGSSTNGCVEPARPAASQSTLRWLDLAKRPRIVIDPPDLPPALAGLSRQVAAAKRPLGDSAEARRAM
jgi:L,D-peptidoglycan transpeptidase YkuD (ErfK/YbiS/YcfS/YnhG family)